jgi:hypothetical protein
MEENYSRIIPEEEVIASNIVSRYGSSGVFHNIQMYIPELNDQHISQHKFIVQPDIL